MCFDNGSRHIGCWGQNTSQIQNKEVYATLCLQASVADKHTVVSAFLAPPADVFNRAQRTMVMMVFVCGSLFANAFFFKDDGADTNTIAHISNFLTTFSIYMA